ncbi:SWF/SNF helicase family protein [Massilia sp. H-1]|nr:SWF/SNF helicase family protein [Massilia sp. H-1]
MKLLEGLLENRHKVLVFSQFVDHLTLIRKHLDRQGIAYQYLDGATPMQERKKRVDAFQVSTGDVFLISLKAGGVGINLTAADYVIHMDPWWNPAVEDQASDRAHRMGQQRPVTIYRLVRATRSKKASSNCTSTSATWPTACSKAATCRPACPRATCSECCRKACSDNRPNRLG